MRESAKVGRRGVVVIPSRLRRRFGIEEGAVVLVEEVPEGVLIRPAVTLPVEVYTPERKAGFLLESWLTRRDYEKARREVRRLGLDPDLIPHKRPS